VPTQKVKETESCIVIKDILPKAPIHYLIVPKEHYKDLLSIPESDSKIFSDIAKVAQDLGKETGDFKLVLNNGFRAGQRVFHIHMHFLAGKELEGI
jgi:histidine triad (HIT) family protein